jgi:hypothetical protein
MTHTYMHTHTHKSHTHTQMAFNIMNRFLVESSPDQVPRRTYGRSCVYGCACVFMKNQKKGGVCKCVYVYVYKASNIMYRILVESSPDQVPRRTSK